MPASARDSVIETPAFSGSARHRIRESGEVNAVLVTFEVTRAPEITLDNRPESSPTHWNAPVYPLPGPRAMTPGETLDVAVDYRGGDDLELRITG